MIELRGERFDGRVVTEAPVNGYLSLPTDDGETILVYEVAEGGRFADYVERWPASIELPPNPIRHLIEGEPEGEGSSP